MIPPKLFDRLCTSLLEQRKCPCPEHDAILLADETECHWPYAASAEQHQEWQDICDQTRAEFEQRVAEYKSFAYEQARAWDYHLAMGGSEPD